MSKVKIRKDNRAANSWALEEGGKQAGSFLAAGSGSGIAGFGAHLAVIDDPISEQDAFSKTRREQLNEWYASGLRTRLMPGGKVVLVGIPDGNIYSQLDDASMARRKGLTVKWFVSI